MAPDDHFLFAAQLDQHIDNIDLHDAGDLSLALEKMEHELYRLYSENKLHCLIVHGIGEGILMKKVHDALTKNPLVKKFGLEEHGGSTIVVFNS